MSMGDESDPIEAVQAISWCLRALACGYGVLAAERAAAINILGGSIPGVDAADLATATKLIEPAAKRTLSTRDRDRDRDRASALSVRLSEQAACLQESEP